MLPNISAQLRRKRKMKVRDAFDYPCAGGKKAASLTWTPSIAPLSNAVRAKLASSSSTRSTKIAGAKADTARRLARRRAARHSAHRGRNHGQHALRHGAHRPHSLHRRGRVPCVEAQRPDPETARRAFPSASSCNRSPSTTSSAFSQNPRPRYQAISALLETEGVRLEFSRPEALREMAEFAFKVNERDRKYWCAPPSHHHGARA